MDAPDTQKAKGNHMETSMVREFEGRSLRVRPWRGSLWVEARNLGEVLGYSDPRDVVELVRSREEDFVEGVDVVKLVGDELAAWKNAARSDLTADDGRVTDVPSDRPDVDRAPQITLLSETAARMVAMLARTPDAARVRRWLAGVWAEIARTGSYTAPASAQTPAPAPPALSRSILYGPMPTMLRALSDWLRSPAGAALGERFTAAADVLRQGFGMAPGDGHGPMVSVGKALARLGLPSRIAHHARIWTLNGWDPVEQPMSAASEAPTLSLLDPAERTALAAVFATKGRDAVRSGDRARAQLAFGAALMAMGGA